jgi:hypothetical protein
MQKQEKTCGQNQNAGRTRRETKIAGNNALLCLIHVEKMKKEKTSGVNPNVIQQKILVLLGNGAGNGADQGLTTVQMAQGRRRLAISTEKTVDIGARMLKTNALGKGKVKMGKLL